MTAARTLQAPAPETDPVLAALARAPKGPSPAPEIEQPILNDPSSRRGGRFVWVLHLDLRDMPDVLLSEEGRSRKQAQIAERGRVPEIPLVEAEPSTPSSPE